MRCVEVNAVRRLFFIEFVCLSVYRIVQKVHPEFYEAWWKVVVWAKEKFIKFGVVISQGVYKVVFYCPHLFWLLSLHRNPILGVLPSVP